MNSRERIPPHPATIVQKKAGPPGREPLPPHPATVMQKKAAPSGMAPLPPHPAAIVQRKAVVLGREPLPPHPATVAQKKAAPPGGPPLQPHMATVQRAARPQAPPPHAALAMGAIQRAQEPVVDKGDADVVPPSERPMQQMSPGAGDSVTLVSTAALGWGHGMYLAYVDARHKKKGRAAGIEVAAPDNPKNEFLVVYSEAYPDGSNVYSDRKTSKRGEVKQGGFARDCDPSLATFALYRMFPKPEKRKVVRNKKANMEDCSGEMIRWVDFDHTPVMPDKNDKDKVVPDPALDKAGHYHPGNKWGAQIPVMKEDLAFANELRNALKGK